EFVTDRIPPVLRPEHPLPRPLSALVTEFGLDVRGSTEGVEVSGVTVRTSEVHPGDLFVSLKGAHSHCASFAAEARERGAVALLADADGAQLASEARLPSIVVDSPRAALGDISAWVYQTNAAPPLMFGVTGTNGKTSTSHMLEGILKQLGLV